MGEETNRTALTSPQTGHLHAEFATTNGPLDVALGKPAVERSMACYSMLEVHALLAHARKVFGKTRTVTAVDRCSDRQCLMDRAQMIDEIRRVKTAGQPLTPAQKFLEFLR